MQSQIENSTNTNLRPRIVYPNSPLRLENLRNIGQFSVDTNREFRNDLSQLSYLKLPESPNVNWDLSEGYGTAKPKPQGDLKLDHILKFILANLEKLKKQPDSSPDCQFLKPNIVCFRGLLRAIMCTPYEKRNDWCMLVSRFKVI